MALQRLKEAAERAKKDLSQQTTTDINLPFITADASGPKHLQMSLTRSKFEQMVDHLIERCRKPVLQALKDAKLQAEPRSTRSCMVGGMTRMPRVQQLVKEIFGKEGHQGVNPDEVVAIGAAIQGAQLLLGSKSRGAAAGRDAAVAGHRDAGRRADAADRAQHDDPDEEEADLLDGGGQPAGGDDQRLPGRERDGRADNRQLGEFNLEGIPPAPRGVPQIEVTFDLDANGILHVTAKDRARGKEANDPDRGLQRPRARTRSRR